MMVFFRQRVGKANIVVNQPVYIAKIWTSLRKPIFSLQTSSDIWFQSFVCHLSWNINSNFVCWNICKGDSEQSNFKFPLLSLIVLLSLAQKTESFSIKLLTHSVIPENIRTSTTEEIFSKSPHTYGNSN